MLVNNLRGLRYLDCGRVAHSWAPIKIDSMDARSTDVDCKIDFNRHVDVFVTYLSLKVVNGKIKIFYIVGTFNIGWNVILVTHLN